MRMSSASPRGRTPANQGNMSWNTKGWIGFSAPGKEKIHDIVLSSKERGWEIQNFVKSQTATTRKRQGFPLSLAQK